MCNTFRIASGAIVQHTHFRSCTIHSFVSIMNNLFTTDLSCTEMIVHNLLQSCAEVSMHISDIIPESIVATVDPKHQPKHENKELVPMDWTTAAFDEHRHVYEQNWFSLE